ncbi:MAG TPA: hypothetical protein VFS38_07130, partial [Actinomycetota bacterium]|nr:hypothetical protein [Actinomycetota bacterium]
LLGYRDRAEIAPAPHVTKVSGSANLRVPAAAAVGGEVLGTWRMSKKGAGFEVEIAPFSVLDLSIFAAEVADISRFLGRPVSLL